MNVFGIGGQSFRSTHINKEEETDRRGATRENNQQSNLNGKMDFRVSGAHVAQNPNGPSKGLVKRKCLRSVECIPKLGLIFETGGNEVGSCDIGEQQESEAGKHRSPVVPANVTGIRWNAVRSGFLSHRASSFSGVRAGISWTRAACCEYEIATSCPTSGSVPNKCFIWATALRQRVSRVAPKKRGLKPGIIRTEKPPLQFPAWPRRRGD